MGGSTRGRTGMMAGMARLRSLVRILLGAALVFAGVSHLTFARKDFRAQVPEFVPLDVDTTVVLSGAVEIALGTAIVTAPRHRLMGWIAAVFFAAVFPGNVSQWRHHRDAFGLDTDRKRLLRLPFQGVLIAAALWSTRGRA
jgi:uncharacterized membrane protein